MLGNTNASSNQNLSISLNGVNKLTYDGTAAKSLDITVAAIGAAAANHNHDSVYAKLSHAHNTMQYNNSNLDTATYGSYWGVIQNSSGDSTKNWLNRIKILHSNSEGFFTEFAQSFTGDERLMHRRMFSGSLSSWKTVLDSANFGSYALPLSGGTMSNTNRVPNLNADMVDGSHAWQLQTLSEAGNTHSGNHQVICQFNVNKDSRFFFRKEDNAHELSIQHSRVSDNSVALYGMSWSNFVTSPFSSKSLGGFMGESNPANAMIGDCDGVEAATPNGSWNHFISLPHRSKNHHTAQIVIPFFNVPELYVRTAPGSTSGNLGNFARFYSNYNSNACKITSTAPNSAEYLWAW